MRKFELILLFTLLPLLSFSQYIEGKVLDAKTNKPIEGVHIYMKNVNRGTLTNEKGKFYLKFPIKIVKKDSIEFSHLAYKEIKISYVSQKKEYIIYLVRDVKKLTEIELYKNQSLKPRIHFSKLASMKKGIHSFGSVLKDGKIYVIGGDSSFEINGFLKTMESFPDFTFDEYLRKNPGNYNTKSYKGDILRYDIDANKWEKDTLKFRKRAYHNINFYNNKIYVLGGKWLSRGRKHEYLDDKIEVLNTEKNTIEIDHTNPHQAVDFASFTYKNNIIVLGGSLKENKFGVKKYSNKVHLFDLSSGYWYQLENMPKAKEVKGILIGDKIYLLGGFLAKPLSEIESYDLVSKKWTKVGDMFYGIRKPAITYKENVIYFYDEGRINTFNIRTKELKEYLIDLSLKSSELYYADNKLFILGGFIIDNYAIHPSRRLFSIDINEFEKTRVNKFKAF